MAKVSKGSLAAAYRVRANPSNPSLKRSANVEVVKNLPREFQNAPLKKSKHQNGAHDTIRGEGMVFYGLVEAAFSATASERSESLQCV